MLHKHCCWRLHFMKDMGMVSLNYAQQCERVEVANTQTEKGHQVPQNRRKTSTRLHGATPRLRYG